MNSTWKRKQEARIAEKGERVKNFLKQKNAGDKERLKREALRAQKQEQSRNKAKQIEERRRQMMSDTQRAKTAHVERLKLHKEQVLMQQKTERALRSKRRQKKA